MPKLPRISETEWEVMRVLWARAPMAASDVIEALTQEDPTWHPKTAKTLLNRLVRKGALAYREVGRAYHYHPRVTEADCVAAVSESFLQRVFGGSLQPMLAHFLDRKNLSGAEIRELRRMLEDGGK